jgi:protein SCO1/2
LAGVIVSFGFVVGILAFSGSPSLFENLPEGVNAIDPPVQLNDFTLTNQQNEPVHLRDLEGKDTLITFGYTHCPDVCPINLASFKQVKKNLGENAFQVNFVFFSVDGKRDTPDVLAKHLQLFDPGFIGITGADAAIRPVTQQFGVYYEIGTPAPEQTDYWVSHTASSFLVDKHGRLIRAYAYQTPPDVIAADIRQNLKAG